LEGKATKTNKQTLFTQEQIVIDLKLSLSKRRDRKPLRIRGLKTLKILFFWIFSIETSRTINSVCEGLGSAKMQGISQGYIPIFFVLGLPWPTGHGT